MRGSPPTFNRPRFRVALVLVLLLASQVGCLRRRFTVRTNPPGAVLYVDNQEIGVTPVSTAYTYYGTREIRLEKDGFEPVSQLHTFSAPWYQYPPLDFVTENLVPWEIRDERDLHFEMVPLRIVPPDELRSRAEQLRTSARNGLVTPLSPMQQGYAPTTVVPPQSNQSMFAPQAGSWSPEPQPQPSPGEFYPGGETLPPGGYELPPLPSGPPR
ncbi:MAG: PEGA domain-containing protein [Pirellulaceae bacterium]